MRAFSFLAGWAGPTGTGAIKDRVGAGATYAFQYLRFFPDWVALGAELQRLSLGSGMTLRSGGQKFESTALSVFARINLMREGAWSPYISGGGGLHSSSVALGTGAGAQSGSSIGPVIMAAAGIERFFYHRAGLFFEARFQRFNLEASKVGGLEAGETLSYTGGIRYWIGTKRKRRK